MNQAAKITLWTFCLFCFLFGGIVWTKPLTPDQKDYGTDELIAQVSIYDKMLPLTLPNQIFSSPQANEEVQVRTGIEPGLLFLFGVGMIGFFGVVRKRI